MTKKDFILIAETLREAGKFEAWCFDSPEDRIAIATHFAAALRRTNPRFDEERFVRAAVP